jgi:DNA processing protein
MARVHTYRVLDRDYPHPLRDLPSPPDPLSVRGELWPGPAVAIVGTRQPSNEARGYAYDLAFRLARRGVAVWSGGAIGIDVAAHSGALDAAGHTVAVVATGLSECYPEEHADLYERIVELGGAIVSPFEVEQHATYATFHRRNAVLAAWTHATVIVQAPIQSGARSTAAIARRLRRPLFVLPASPWDWLGAGNLVELARGATMLTNDAQIFRCLPFMAGPEPKAREPTAPPAHGCPTPKIGADHRQPTLFEHLPPAHRAVLEAAREAPRHIDDLCAETGQPTQLVRQALLTLTLEDVLVEGPAGWFRRVKCS